MGRIPAIVVLRTKLLLRRMRGKTRLANLLAGALLGLIGLALSGGLALGFGMMMHALVLDGDSPALLTGCTIFFYACAFFGIVLPVLRGALDEGLDATPFLVFPIGRRQLFGITLGAACAGSEHLLYLPALGVVLLTGIVLPGANLPAGLALVGLTFLCNVAWGHLLALTFSTLMRARRVKELLAFAGITLLLGVSLLPLAIEQVLDRPEESLGAWARSAGPLLTLGGGLAPSLAGRGLAALHQPGGLRTALGSIVGLGLWTGAGLVAGYAVFTRFHLTRHARPRKPTDTERTAKTERTALFSFDRGPLALLPSQVRAVAAKDLRYLLRSVVGRFNLVVAPLFVLILCVLLEDHVDQPLWGTDPRRLLLFGMLFYAVMFSNNFVNNAFAWEGSGIGAYFTSPVSLRQVLVGKNLASWLYNAMLLVLILVTWSIAMGPPDPLMLVTALLLFASAHLFFTSWGNVVSVLFPLPRDVSALANSPSQVAVLLSMLALVVMLLLIGPVVAIPAWLGRPWLQAPGLAALLAALCGGYALSLRMASRLLADRKDRLIETLRVPR